MKLPDVLLSSVRGPVAVVVLAACGAPPAAITPEPTPVAPLVVEAPPPIDPVAYDASLEAARLEVEDARVLSDETRRERRIVAATHTPRAPRLGGLGHVPPRWMAACGRG